MECEFKMKKVIRLAALVLAIAIMATVGLAGCGANGSAGKTVNSKGQVVIRIAVSGGSGVEAVEDMLRDYASKNKGVAFKQEPVVGEYTQKLITQVAAGTAPDLVWVSDTNVRTLASKGVLVDLAPYYKKYKFDSSDMYESMLLCGQYAGKQYMMPRDYNRVVLLYNKNLFDNYGVAYPKNGWTWEEFKTTARKFAKLSNSGKVYLQRGANLQLHWGAAAPQLIYGLGGTIADKVVGGTKANMNTPGTIAAIKELKALADEGAIVNNFKNDIGGYETGKIAMTATSFPTVGGAITSEERKFDSDIVAWPVLPKANYVGCGSSGYAVVKTSKCQEEAAGFAIYVASPAGQKAFSKSGQCVPVLKSLANDKTWRDTVPGINYDALMPNDYLVDCLQPDVTVGSDKAATAINSCWTEMLSAYLSGIYDAEKAAEYGNKSLENAFKER